jgi:hypothetical protein
LQKFRKARLADLAIADTDNSTSADTLPLFSGSVCFIKTDNAINVTTPIRKPKIPGATTASAKIGTNAKPKSAAQHPIMQAKATVW